MYYSVVSPDLDLSGAAMRADELAAKGDMAGRATWHRILDAIKILLTGTPPDDTPLH